MGCADLCKMLMIVFWKSLSERALQGFYTWIAMRLAQPAAAEKNEAGRPRCIAARIGDSTFTSLSLTRDIKSQRRAFSKQLSYVKVTCPYIRL